MILGHLTIAFVTGVSLAAVALSLSAPLWTAVAVHAAAGAAALLAAGLVSAACAANHHADCGRQYPQVGAKR
jgi:hypothetical protein